MKARLKKCSRVLAKSGCDALLSTNFFNVDYLTGCPGLGGCFLISRKDKPIFFTNFLYRASAQKLSGCDLVVNKQGQNLFDLVAKKAKLLKVKCLGFESNDLKFRQYRKLKSALDRQKIGLLATSNLIENLRAIKTPGEISLIKKSIKISQEAFKFTLEIVDGSMSEKDLTIEVERFMRQRGDNRIAFNTIVACGKNTVFPHHLSNQTKIGNKFFLIDLGSKYCGYCADLTRVFFWGKMPLAFKSIYNTVKKSQAQAIAKIKAGVRACDVDKAARAIIEKKGWGKYFGHGLGHGIGMAVHEEPGLNPKNTSILKEGMVLTIEPGIYIPNQFGIRREDMILVKKNKAEVLSGDVDW